LTTNAGNLQGNINWPRVPFIDPVSGFPALPWLLWLQSPNFISMTTGTQTINGNQTVTGNEFVSGTLTALGGISGGTF
jgi:hypothetical protein